MKRIPKSPALLDQILDSFQYRFFTNYLQFFFKKAYILTLNKHFPSEDATCLFNKNTTTTVTIVTTIDTNNIIGFTRFISTDDLCFLGATFLTALTIISVFFDIPMEVRLEVVTVVKC